MKWAFSAMVGLVLLLTAGCGDDGAEEIPPDVPPEPPPVWSLAERAEAIDAGTEALDRLGCNRCHAIDAVPRAAAVSEADIDAPDLSRIGERLRLDWLASYIRAPHDVRPMLEEAMVRTSLEAKDLETMVRYFAAVANAPLPESPSDEETPALEAPPTERIEAGRALFLSRGCTACHTFGNLATGVSVAQLEAVGTAARMAPNLRFARERMLPEVAAGIIVDPECRAPDSMMVDLGVDEEEAATIVDFLFHADPQLLPKADLPDLHPPPAVERPVSWEEVKARVFDRTCVECHRNDHESDPGPGNVGAFGWHAEDLAMRTYESLIAGVSAGPGARFSVLEPRPGADNPFIINMMIMRRLEVARDHIAPFQDHELPGPEEGEPGMPMGLPPVSVEDMSLVRAWIEQGCPGPVEVSGTPGTLDGADVPDGPLTINRGCQLRAPAAERPPWAAR